MKTDDIITEKDVETAARSVGLELGRQELERVRCRLEKQLEGFRILNEIDTDGVQADECALPCVCSISEKTDRGSGV